MNTMPGFDTTSTFGPAAGLAGGALSCGDNYAPGDYRLPRVMGGTARRGGVRGGVRSGVTGTRKPAQRPSTNRKKR